MKIKDVNIEFLGHDGFFISNGKKIIIDPYNISNQIGKVDIILITHGHYDHCSIQDIEKIVKPETIIVCTADSQSKVLKIEGAHIQLVEPGESLEVDGIKIETIPAYNKKKDYHLKSEGWVGYIIKLNSVIIYHAGDTDHIPEMHKLSGYGKHGNEFVAFLPVSGKYVMNAEEAAEVASLISPDLAIPMHYGAGVVGKLEDAERFVELCREKNIKAEILDKI